jgi:RNA polymerase sigma-70 factor (ECF subfamily)
MTGSRVANSSETTRPAHAETERLVAAAREGSREAFGTLYERYARFVHGILLANAERDDVPDLVQDVFFRAFRQLHTLRDANAFGAWLATLARNEARMRRRRTRPSEPLSDQMAGPAPEVDRDALEMDVVLRALHRLPERYREPLILRLVEQMGGEDIATRLGLTHGTVRVYLHHGLRLLREQLAPAHD